MYTENYKVDVETSEMFDWYFPDLLEKPPYCHYDMVIMLAQGKFVLEGKPSNFSHAEAYAQQYSDRSDVWDALKAVDEEVMELAINGPF